MSHFWKLWSTNFGFNQILNMDHIIWQKWKCQLEKYTSRFIKVHVFYYQRAVGNGYIDVGDGCWRRNVLATTSRWRFWLLSEIPTFRCNQHLCSHCQIIWKLRWKLHAISLKVLIAFELRSRIFHFFLLNFSMTWNIFGHWISNFWPLSELVF